MASNKPTLATLNVKIGLILEKLMENDRVHDKIVAQFNSYEDRFHKLFENGPISNIQKEIVRIEDKVDKVDDDVTRLRATTRWAFGVLFSIIVPVCGWGIIKLLETLFHIN